MCGPLSRRNLRRWYLASQPTLRLLFNSPERLRHWLRSASRQPRLENPFIDRHSCSHRRILIKQVLLQVGQKLFGRDALESELIEVVAQESVEACSAEGKFEVK